MLSIGVDTGGTFTDIVVFDGQKLQTVKLPSTPDNPARTIIRGILPFMSAPLTMIHGTTVATNAFLQKKMARTALVATKGFEHLLHIGRQNRNKVFSLRPEKPPTLVPLALCFGVKERTLADGSHAQRIVAREIEKLATALKKKNVQAVAVVFLHAYKNPEHEKIAAAIFRQNGFAVTASYEIMAEHREYERAVVTVLNAALMPVVSDYIEHLEQKLGRNKLYIIQSNGGLLSPGRIMGEPIHTMLSGPAGGVIAAQKIARLKRLDRLITLDMGGTSTDVALIKDYAPALSRRGALENLPLRLPMMEIATVGAGGGSLARIDRGGALQVGPESAGADPGPACYGKADLATVTDAFVVTGIIQPELFLGGKMKIFPERSFRAVEKIARQIKKNVHETAEGIIAISVSSMERAIRSISVEKGEDPRLFTLLPFGGAGAMAAPQLCQRLGLKKIVVPPFQGLFSALGMLMADFQKEFSRSLLRPYSPTLAAELSQAFAALKHQAAAILKAEGFKPGASDILEFLEMRYRGQSYELTIPYQKSFLKKFHGRHRLLYGYSLPDDDCEIVNIRTVAVGHLPSVPLAKKKPLAREAAVADRRRIYYQGYFREFDFYQRENLNPGEHLRSPAIVAAADATVVVDGSFSARVDEYANIIMQRIS